MRKATAVLVVFALGVFAAQTAFAANVVRISQVYGGNGNTYNQDYIELFNSSNSPVNIGGWSLQYGSATGTSNLGACTLCLTTLPANATIPACGYYLIGLNKSTVSGAALPVTPDFDSPTGNNISSTNGKIGLKSDATLTACSPQSAFVDLVGWGSANCWEGAGATAALTATTGAVRKLNGQLDGDNNNLDFDIVSAPVPRNSATPPVDGCTPIAVEGKTWTDVKVLYH